jgi:Zinc dependent phospholipase C
VITRPDIFRRRQCLRQGDQSPFLLLVGDLLLGVLGNVRLTFRATTVAALLAPTLLGYSVLSHEAIIDSTWDQSIKPILLKRFPNSTEEDLQKAHGFAYGGAIIQDLGYYPFGSHLFSDLVHYVRSGDFVVNMLAEARDLNEYAFALGSVAHYASDNNGHPIAVNPSVALTYPKLRSRFGKVVTYEDSPPDHLKVEFSFDVAQVANGHYAPQAYHDFIGFQVSKDVLDRAFQKTYGLQLKDVFGNVDLALGTYRHTVGGLLPEMTKVAWQDKKKDLMKEMPGVTKRKFVYNLSRASFEKEWGHNYERPGIGARILAWVLKIMPKIGPFKALSFKAPSPETERLFMKSFNATLDAYRALLAQVRTGRPLELADTNFDTGMPARSGDYRLADEAVNKLLQKLQDHKFEGVDTSLRTNLLEYYLKGAPAEPKAAAALQALQAYTPQFTQPAENRKN